MQFKGQQQRCRQRRWQQRWNCRRNWGKKLSVSLSLTMHGHWAWKENFFFGKKSIYSKSRMNCAKQPTSNTQQKCSFILSKSLNLYTFISKSQCHHRHHHHHRRRHRRSSNSKHTTSIMILISKNLYEVSVCVWWVVFSVSFQRLDTFLWRTHLKLCASVNCSSCARVHEWKTWNCWNGTRHGTFQWGHFSAKFSDTLTFLPFSLSLRFGRHWISVSTHFTSNEKTGVGVRLARMRRARLC